MIIDKKLISHIVAEFLIISGLSFYYHKKCTNLQLQINDLNVKLEKINGVNYLNAIKRQEQFENQTVQHINKIYSILNNITNNTNIGFNNNPVIDSLKINNEIIKENFYSPSSNETPQQSNFLQSHNVTQKTQKTQTSNPLMNTLSMLGPLTTMFKVVMEPKPPHPNEIFENIDIKSQLNTKKIVEIEDVDNEINSEMLDNELKDELNDLRSNVTSTFNTPILTPKLSLTHSVPSLDLCDNGVCKLNIENNSFRDIQESEVKENKEENRENKENKENKEEDKENDKSSPLRYISQPLENKRGRPKKNL